MARRRVGIIGAAGERHCLYLAHWLREEGAEPLLLHAAPDVLPCPLSLEGGRAYYQGEPLDGVGVYYLRLLFLPDPAFDAAPVAGRIAEEGYKAYAAERERYSLWTSWLRTVPLWGGAVVNRVESVSIHFHKPFQLEALRLAGVPVPPTLVTSDPGLLRAFAAGREVVYKPVAGGALCRRLEPGDFTPERLAALASAPVLFQEYVPGDDMRAYVLAGKVIAAARIAGDGPDYRAGPAEVEPTTLPDEAADLCVRACQVLGLTFSAVDLKRTPGGRYILLECNPSPMFEGFDAQAGAAVGRELARYLIRLAADRAGEASPHA